MMHISVWSSLYLYVHVIFMESAGCIPTSSSSPMCCASDLTSGKADPSPHMWISFAGKPWSARVHAHPRESSPICYTGRAGFLFDSKPR